jgi:hypothetical protein
MDPRNLEDDAEDETGREERQERVSAVELPVQWIGSNLLPRTDAQSGHVAFS